MIDAAKILQFFAKGNRLLDVYISVTAGKNLAGSLSLTMPELTK